MHANPTPRRLTPSTKLAARRFQLFAPDGLLEINVVRRTRKLSATIGTTIELEPSATTAQVVADLSSVVGQRYLLEADVPNAWTLDSIETEPSNSVEDYQFVAYEAGSKRLQIHLSQPLTPNRPMRLMIRAHRAPTFVLRADDFRPLRFTNVDSTSHLVAIAPDPSFRLDVSGDSEVEQVDPDGLSPTTANLLHPRSGGLVFQDGQRADTMTVKVTREDPTFTAEIHVLAEADTSALSESYRLVCTPESTPLTSLLVFLSESRAEEITWSVATDTNVLLSAQKVPPQELQPARVNQTGEAWELTLRNPQDKPIEIRGQRKTTFTAAKNDRVGHVTKGDLSGRLAHDSVTGRLGTVDQGKRGQTDSLRPGGTRKVLHVTSPLSLRSVAERPGRSRPHEPCAARRRPSGLGTACSALSCWRRGRYYTTRTTCWKVPAAWRSKCVCPPTAS